MRILPCSVYLTLTSLWSVQAQEAVPAALLNCPFPVAQAEVMARAKFLADPRLQGRAAGSDQDAVAALYIATEFARIGLMPAGDADSYEQQFDIPVAVMTADGVRAQARKTRNVLAWLPGSDERLKSEYILLGAHYDHIGMQGGQMHPGADDNASGVAVLLAIAQAWASAVEPRRSILFAAFGAEEIGLRGSEYFSRHPVRPLRDLVLMINMDMLGRGRFMDIKSISLLKTGAGIKRGAGVGVIGAGSSPELRPILDAVFKKDALPLYAPEDFPLVGEYMKSMSDGRSDHAPFEARGVPFLFFSTSMTDDYHKPTDTLDKLDAKTMHRNALAIYRTALAVDHRDQRPQPRATRPTPLDAADKQGKSLTPPQTKDR